MAKVNSEEYNKALEEYLQEGIGWDAGMFDINAKNNQGDYEQFAADSFHAGWQAANESEGKCNIAIVSGNYYWVKLMSDDKHEPAIAINLLGVMNFQFFNGVAVPCYKVNDYSECNYR